MASTTTAPPLLTPAGPFSLAASARFLEGFAPAAHPGGQDDDERPTLRLAFPLDGTGELVGAAVTQEDDGRVSVGTDARDPEAVAAQVRRVLSLDVDGEGFAGVGEADPVVGRLQRAYPGLRPVCFASPYEAACWGVIGQRVRMTQAAATKERIAREHGGVLDVAGVPLPVFPGPRALHDVAGTLPLPAAKRERLAALAAAALDGVLDADRLRSTAADDALADLQRLPGIGPFSAELVLVRGAGAPDVFPRSEGRLHDSMRQLWDAPDADVPRLARVAARWSPYRSWVALLVRAHREATTGEIASGRRVRGAAHLPKGLS
ncbi:DNA-3-methyladenine glycosylase family protein [Pseudokineococcus sp. 1T1Z-3]|uniref:DNA-3-methyladenine glycosylase family protein n=1 Tax=Pseudokineococcus sp. 1T1Z-3 TaxID=3132745 RepID=UPI00309C8A0C